MMKKNGHIFAFLRPYKAVLCQLVESKRDLMGVRLDKKSEFPKWLMKGGGFVKAWQEGGHRWLSRRGACSPSLPFQ